MAIDAFFPKITLPKGETDIRKGEGLGIKYTSENGKVIVMVVDAFEGGEPTRGLIDWLKSIDVKQIDLAVATHAHGDHFGGFYDIAEAGIKIKDFRCYHIDSIREGNSESRKDSDNLLKLIRWLQARGTRVLFVDHGDVLEFGDISWHIYRKQPKGPAAKDDPNAWSYVNDGSLVLCSPELSGIIFGDGPAAQKEAIAYFQKKFGKTKFLIWVTVSHHGGHFSMSNAQSARNAGCEFAYESCVERRGPGKEEWTEFGARRLIQNGVTVWMQDENIYIHAAAGKITFKQGSKMLTYDIPYQGKESKVTGKWEYGTKGWWYKYSNGGYATGWKQIVYKGEPCWFLFDDDGWMLTGWRYEGWSGGESWFFMDYQTGVMKTGWNMLPWGDGKMDTFLLDPKTGAMLTGWQYSTKDGKAGWYYLDPKSGAMHTGWIFENGYWYFLGADGCMVTGWVDWKGRKCYLEPVSGRNQGHCYTSCVDTIGGKTYSFDADGYATEISGSTAAEAPTIIKNSGFHAGRNCGTRTEKVKYIVIHYTGNDGATAAENVSYFNGGNRGASAHYFVDRSGEIREYCDPAAYYAWHCGGSLESSHHPLHNICSNRNSIGIEICTHNNGGRWEFTAAAVNAAITLTKYLMAKFGISADHVCRHYDVTGKACPRVPGWGAVGGSAEWDKFKAAIAVQPRELTDNEKFIEQIGAMARADMAKSGICAAVTVAQAILESGWGKSDLAVKANNIFGMKCSLSGNTWPGSTWDGKSAYNKSTGEYYSGSYTTVKADFRKYGSWGESVADHSAYLAGAKSGSALRYAGLVGCTNYKQAAQIIKNGGYATSPDYVAKICNIVEQYNLNRFNTNYSGSITSVPTQPVARVPYLVKTGSGVQIYKTPGGAVARSCPAGVYTIVEEKDGYGRLKSGAGWLKLSTVTKK